MVSFVHSHFRISQAGNGPLVLKPLLFCLTQKKEIQLCGCSFFHFFILQRHKWPFTGKLPAANITLSCSAVLANEPSCSSILVMYTVTFGAQQAPNINSSYTHRHSHYCMMTDAWLFFFFCPTHFMAYIVLTSSRLQHGNCCHQTVKYHLCAERDISVQAVWVRTVYSCLSYTAHSPIGNGWLQISKIMRTRKHLKNGVAVRNTVL